MYVVNLHEFSMHNSHASNVIHLKLEYELRFYEGTINFDQIRLTDQYNQIQNVLDIQVSAKLNNIAVKKTIGQVQASLYAFNQYSNNSRWEWVFDSNDISTIEKVRSGDVSFEVEITTVIQIAENDTKILPFTGKGPIRFPETDWLSFIRHFGYSTKYGLSLPSSLLNDKSWFQAFELLEDARLHMQRGKTHDALGQCLSIIESYMDSAKRGGPYSDKVWDELFHDVIPQKKEGIVRLISGVSTYLNMVGHHRNSRQKENGNLPRVPIDQYEAELLVAVSQLVVTYLERLREGVE